MCMCMYMCIYIYICTYIYIYIYRGSSDCLTISPSMQLTVLQLLGVNDHDLKVNLKFTLTSWKLH